MNNIEKFTKEDGCPLCKNKEYKLIDEKNRISNIYCIKCGGIFNSLELNDADNRGLFMQGYVTLSRQDLYNNRFKED